MPSARSRIVRALAPRAIPERLGTVRSPTACLERPQDLEATSTLGNA